MSETLVTEAPAEVEATEPVAPVETPAVAPEVKAVEGDKPETDGKADEKVGAPEAYEAFTFPEGVEVDEALMGEFQPLAKELGLTQEQAQRLVDMQAKELFKAADTQVKNWEKLNTEWQDASKSDKEIGGVKFAENIAVAKKALTAFGTPELVEAIELTGVGNHPEFLRFMYRVGKTVKEDVMHSGRAGAAPQDRAKTLFPNQN